MGGGVIDRERIEDVLERNKDGFPILSVNELDELFRVYLAWLDAPETEISESHLCDLGLLSDDAMALRGKRVRIVGVK